MREERVGKAVPGLAHHVSAEWRGARARWRKLHRSNAQHGAAANVTETRRHVVGVFLTMDDGADLCSMKACGFLRTPRYFRPAPLCREIAVLTPHSQNRQPAYRAQKRHSTARLRTDARVLHATVPSSSGPARNMAKFEPAAWSWAQMTSGSGAPKRVLSEGTITFKRLRT